MRLIDNNMRKQRNIQQSCYSFELGGDLSDTTKKMLKEELLEFLKSKGINDVTILEVSLNVGVWAKTRKGDEL